MVKMVQWFDKNNYEQLDYIIFDSYTMELMYHTVYIVRVRDNLKYYRNPAPWLTVIWYTIGLRYEWFSFVPL